jgi:nitrogen-specific signal transduction histidine kinase
MKSSKDILQLLPVAVLVFDGTGRFCYANDFACQLFNIDCRKSQGTMYHLLLPDLNIANCSPHPGAQAQGLPGKPLAHLHDGKIVLTRQRQKLFCRSLSLPNENSHGEQVVLLVEDMNDNSNLAGRVLEEERLMGVTEISNTMAHKLNQYLQVIMGYISLMTLEMEAEHQCYDYLNKILEQLENIRATTYMLSNIHRYAIIERPDGRRMFDLDMAAEEHAVLNFK